MPSPPQTPVRSRNATHPEVIPDSPITGPETSRRLSHPVLLRGAFYAIGCAVTFGVITSLAKFTYDHGASPQTVVWSRILAAAVLLGGWHVLSSRTRKPLNTPVASEKTSAALPVLVVAISVAVMSLGYLGSVYFIPVSLSALLFFTFPFVSQHNNAGEVFFFKPCTIIRNRSCTPHLSRGNLCGNTVSEVC